MKTLLTLLVLLFSSSVVADDISDFEIEGMSIGDSLLDYMGEEKIKKQIEKNRYMYTFLNEDFGEVYLFNKFKIYDHLSFFVKPNDKKYSIFSISGTILYEDNFDKCLKKQKEIVKELSNLYLYVERDEGVISMRIDPSGKSKVHYIAFYFDTGDSIRVDCNEYEKRIKIKNNWEDVLNVMVVKKEVYDWFN